MKKSRQKIEETERLLRASRIRYDVEIKPVAYRDGLVDIEVSTRDAWTLDATGTFSRAGGENKTSYGASKELISGRVGLLPSAQLPGNLR